MTKKCPKCSISIEKNGGCLHMVCNACKHQFCWECMGDYSPGHIRMFHTPTRSPPPVNQPLMHELETAQRRALKKQKTATTHQITPLPQPTNPFPRRPQDQRVTPVAGIQNPNHTVASATSNTPKPIVVSQRSDLNVAEPKTPTARNVMIQEAVFKRSTEVLKKHNLLPKNSPLDNMKTITRNVPQTDGRTLTQNYYLVEKSIYDEIQSGLQQLIHAKPILSVDQPTYATNLAR